MQGRGAGRFWYDSDLLWVVFSVAGQGGFLAKMRGVFRGGGDGLAVAYSRGVVRWWMVQLTFFSLMRVIC